MQSDDQLIQVSETLDKTIIKELPFDANIMFTENNPGYCIISQFCNIPIVNLG